MLACVFCGAAPSPPKHPFPPTPRTGLDTRIQLLFSVRLNVSRVPIAEDDSMLGAVPVSHVMVPLPFVICTFPSFPIFSFQGAFAVSSRSRLFSQMSTFDASRTTKAPSGSTHPGHEDSGSGRWQEGDKGSVHGPHAVGMRCALPVPRYDPSPVRCTSPAQGSAAHLCTAASQAPAMPSAHTPRARGCRAGP